MSTKTWKPEHDAAQRELAEKNARIRELTNQVQTLRAARRATWTADEIGAEIRRLSASVEDSLEKATVAIADKMAQVESDATLAARIEDLENVLAEEAEVSKILRSELIGEQIDRADALRRLHVAERREADLFHRLTRRLPKGWEGRSIRSLAEYPEGVAGLNAMVAEALDWCNERVRGRPLVVTAAEVVEVEAAALPPEAEALSPMADSAVAVEG